MARKANPALIGAFVLGAIVLGVAGLIVFGGGKFFAQTQGFVAYFEEDVKGLSIGSPVTFQGVKVGSVTDIRVVVDPKEMKIWTPVFFAIEADRFQDIAGHKVRFEKGVPGVKRLIERGMRGRLETQSFVTGQLAISLDLHPDTPIRLVGRKHEEIEMPTIQSSTEKIARTIEHLPIDQIVASLQKSLDGVDKLVNAPEVKETLRSLKAAAENLEKLVRNVDSAVKPVVADVGKTLDVTREAIKDSQKLIRDVDAKIGPLAASADGALKDARKLIRDVDSQVGPLAESVQQALVSARAALNKAGTTIEQAQDALVGVNGLVAEGSPMAWELQNTLREVSAAARSIRVLSDYLDRHPDALLFGKGKGGQ